ncbi:MAG: OmpA family protein [Flavobacteriales bacterium]|nr:OmpA family protein [Flavobacteriales bacterium]
MNKLFALPFLFFAFSATAQMKKADEAFEHHHYDEAIELYEQAIRKDLDNDKAITNLALCFWKTNRFAEAEYWFTRAALMNEDPIVKLWYSQVLIANEKYVDATTWLEKYIAAETNVDKTNHASQLLAWTKGIASGALSKKKYKVSPLDFNSEDLDFAPFIAGNKLYFSSNRKGAMKKSGENDPWTNDRFTDLFVVEITGESFSEPTPAQEFPLTVYHDGPVFINAAGTEAYMTTTDVASGKRGFDDQNNTRLKLVRLTREGGEWKKTKALSFNNNNYNIAHAALSPDEQTLVFSSDMPGGEGQMDLYSCRRNSDGSWGKPENLGKRINTPGNEVFPSFNGDVFYFSSDYMPGFGGLDVFHCALAGDEIPENAGLPLNSPKDDFGVCFKADGRTGYFTSNRNNNQKDDVLYFTQETGFNISGTLIDCFTHLPIVNARVDLLGDNNFVATAFTDSLGSYSYTTFTQANYKLVAKHDLYAADEGCSGSLELTTMGMLDGQTLQTALALSPLEAAQLEQAFLCGRIWHGVYGNPLSEVQVCVKGAEQEFEFTTSGLGSFFIPLTNGEDVEVSVSRTAFEDFKTNLQVVKSEDQCHALEIAMQPDKKVMPPMLTPEIRVQPGMVIELYHVYFDRDKSELRDDAMPDLLTFLDVLRKNPGVSGVISAHTDSRASDKYNYALSQRRADAVRQYLIDNGIAADRLTARGFGEAKLLNECIDGYSCTEEQHQRNRRVEFEVRDTNHKVNAKSEEPVVLTNIDE